MIIILIIIIVIIIIIIIIKIKKLINPINIPFNILIFNPYH